MENDHCWLTCSVISLDTNLEWLLKHTWSIGTYYLPKGPDHLLSLLNIEIQQSTYKWTVIIDHKSIWIYILINYCPSSRLRILMSMIPLLTSVLFIFFNLRIPLSMIHFYLSVLFIFWSENHIVNDLPTYVRPVYKNPPSPPCPITFGKSARTSRRPACWPLREFY